MSEDIASMKAQLVKAYLLVHGCVQVNYTKDGEYIFLLTLDDRRCQLWVSREWLNVSTKATIAERLDHLQVIPFMRDHSLAWLNVKGGEDVLTSGA
jgi:hypothetical protein